MLLVNGIPLVVIEAKTPVRASQSWLDAALQVHDDYETNVPELFVPNVVLRRHRGQGVPLRLRRPAGRPVGAVAVEADDETPALSAGRDRRSTRCCARTSCSDMLASFTAYATRQEEAPHQDHRPLPAVRGDEPDRRARRRRASPKKGLIWHFQGSGKSLLMLFAARKLRLHPALKNPDRDDRGRPHRPRQPDLEHLLRRRHAQPGEGRQPRRSCSAC